jgi:DNA-binding transcriptional LysR family regulator
MSQDDPLLRGVEDVTFAQLRTFACAARAGSFAKAAEQLDISQPAVSEQIRTLEDRLGRHLFERRRGTTSILTAEGEEALEIAQTILDAGSKLFGNRRKSAEKVALRISAGPFLRENYVRPLLPRLYREFPDVEITLLPAASSTEVVRGFEKGDIDIAVFAIASDEVAPQHARQICELPIALVAAPGTRDRLAAGEVSLEDFQYIFPGNKEDDARWARKVMRNLGLTPRKPLLFIQFVDALAQMVEDGQGIGHLMTNSIADKISAGKLEPLDLAIPPMRRFIGRSPRSPEVARAVEQLLREVLIV